MTDEALLEALLALARETGLVVRRAGASAGGEGFAPSASAVCRVRGALTVVLLESEPVAERIAVLADGLRRHLPSDWLDAHFLPPAVRACLDA